MSAPQTLALSAIAFQLSVTLESYEADVAALVRAPLDADLYARVSRQMDQMRMYTPALPSLAVAWVELMIRHFELTHGLWRLQQEGTQPPDLGQLQARLSEAVLRLSRKCTQLMPSA